MNTSVDFNEILLWDVAKISSEKWKQQIDEREGQEQRWKRRRQRVVVVVLEQKELLILLLLLLLEEKEGWVLLKH